MDGTVHVHNHPGVAMATSMQCEGEQTSRGNMIKTTFCWEILGPIFYIEDTSSTTST